MSRRDLQNDIIEGITRHGGFSLSDGTLNIAHLLPRAHDLLVAYRIITPLTSEIRDCFHISRRDVISDGMMWAEQYQGRLKLKENSDEVTVWVKVHDFFNEVSPDGYWFGSHDNDSAYIGWFKEEDANG